MSTKISPRNSQRETRNAKLSLPPCPFSSSHPSGHWSLTTGHCPSPALAGSISSPWAIRLRLLCPSCSLLFSRQLDRFAPPPQHSFALRVASSAHPKPETSPEVPQ